MEKEAREQNEQRRFHRQRPEAMRIGFEERQAIEFGKRPQEPASMIIGPIAATAVDRRPGVLVGVEVEPLRRG